MKSNRLYIIVDHAYLGNIQGMMGTNPIGYNTYEDDREREKGKVRTHMTERKNPNTYDRKEKSKHI